MFAFEVVSGNLREPFEALVFDRPTIERSLRFVAMAKLFSGALAVAVIAK